MAAVTCIFKDKDDLVRYSCLLCNHLLQDPVQLGCGHRLCRDCAEKLIASKSQSDLKCPDEECGEPIDDTEDGAYYFPDRFVRREIQNLAVICRHSEAGCNWEGRYEELQQHVDACDFASSPCQHCGELILKADIDAHSQSCPLMPKPCPLAELGCTMLGGKESAILQHLQVSLTQHVSMVVSKLESLEKRLGITESLVANNASIKMVESCPSMPEPCPLVGYVMPASKGSEIQHEAESLVVKDAQQKQLNMAESDGAIAASGLPPEFSSRPSGLHSKTQFAAHLYDGGTLQPSMPDGVEMDMHTIEWLVTERVHSLREEMKRVYAMQLRERDKEIATLKANLTKIEKTIRSKSAEQDDRDFRLSLIENSNHDGSMIWKIPQFSQRKIDAENGKYTSIFSLPFYSGRYGYKMCLRLYIMGDGIGKGTHMSIYYVVMRGEFDNFLQFPFTHKVTFKLINHAGGRDIVDTFQPDPMSSSFRKPRSDMNVASGCPRFVSHTELERGGFIVDDTIFIKCMIGTT